MRQSLRVFPLFFLLLSLGMLTANAHSQVVISQIYGGGGNSGATYKNDFIELFNRGTSAVDVTGWTIQYASSSGTLWETTSLSGSIQPGSYFLVQEIQGAGGTADLPSPDAVGTIALSATSAKIALTNNGTLLAGACPSSAAIVDFVGYGGASCAEQTSAPALTNTTALFRNGNGCTDSGNNANDFQVGAPNPRNRTSATNPCGGSPASANPIATATANPQLISPSSTVLFSVIVTPGSNPTSTGIAVKGDLSPIGGSAIQSIYDDATNGDVTAGDNRFAFRTTVPSNITPGVKHISFTISDTQGRTATVDLRITIGNLASQHGLVFSQVAVGGGYKTIFLLTNPSTNPSAATAHFYTGQGEPMQVTINGSTASSFPITVPANGSAKLVADYNSDSFFAGWAEVVSSADLNGNAIFQLSKGSELFCEASVPAAFPAASLDFYAEEEDGFNTGIAMANPTSITAEGVMTFRDKQGAIYATSPVVLAPLEKNAVFLFQISEGAQSGRVQIEMTKGYISAAVLRINTSALFSTISLTQPSYSAAGVAALFSPTGGVTQRIISEINNAQTSIDIAIYSFTTDSIRDALIAAKSRGVAIRIIADTSQASGSGSEIAALEQAGFQVKRSSGGSGGIMHNKYMIIDERILFTGSFNWSTNAEENNYENAIFIQASPVVRRYMDDFSGIWAK